MNAPVPGGFPKGKHPKRRLRNYLLDPRLQLKYAGVLVAVSLVLMAGLGAIIYRIANVAARQARTAVQQSSLAADQAERAFRESQTTASMLAMQRMDSNPEMGDSIQQDLDAANARAAHNLDEVRRQRGSVDAQRAEIERNRLRTLYVMLAAALVVVALLGLAGIVITHRIVGPVFKIKRLLRQVGAGKLDIRERLRKGDELEDLFDTFLEMVASLRKAQELEIARLDDALRAAEASGAAADVLAKLRALRAEMQAALAPDERPPPGPVASF